MERLKKQMEFILEIDKIKEIYRQNYLADGSRRENDAEHSWHIALMAVLLKEHADVDVNLERVIPMLLLHDLVEIDAGDTYAYDEKAALDKAQREQAAAERIFGMLPEDQSKKFRELWDEFEEYKTPDARFAHVMDNFQPFLLNAAANGKSWTEHGVKKSQIYKRNVHTPETSGKIWECMKAIIEDHVTLGHVIDDM